MFKLDLASYYRDVLERNVTKFGVLPQMARAYIGRLNASSFNERVNSCAKDIMDPQRTSMNERLMEYSTILRINKAFMDYVHAELMSTTAFQTFLAERRGTTGGGAAIK